MSNAALTGVRRLWNAQTFPMRPSSGLPRLWPRAWVTILPMAMILGTEYKLRQRQLAQSLDGAVDSAVLIELAVYALVVAYLVLFVMSPPRWQRPTAIQFFMRGYAVAMFLSVAYSEYPKLGAVRGMQLLVAVMCASAIASRATRRQILQLAHAYLVLVTVSVFVGLVYRVPFSINQEDRFNWLYVHSVTAGAMLTLGLVIGTALLTNRSRLPYGSAHWPRLGYVFCLAVMTGGLIGTETRGAIGAAVAGLFVVVFLTVPRTERLPLGIVGGLALGLTVALFWDKILTYLERGESVKTLSTVSNRTELWSIALNLVKERPITGWGLSTSRGIFFDKVGLGGAHNAVINVAVDGGLVGLALWTSFVVAIAVGIVRLYRHGHRDAPLLAGLLTALMVNGLTVEGVGSGIGVSSLWLLLCGAWVGVLQRDLAGSTARTTATRVELIRDQRAAEPSSARNMVDEISRV
ncbi:MAG: O-antigen ligase family protein [Acidimicrobiales bacterium]